MRSPISRVALVFVHFPHDEVVDVGEWVGLVQIGEVFEREVLLYVLDDMCV
jgi:hypothetical protein